MAEQPTTPSDSPKKQNKPTLHDLQKEARALLVSIRNAEKQSAKETRRLERDAESIAKSTQKAVRSLSEKTKSDLNHAFKEVDKIRNETRDSYNRFKRTYEAALNNQSTGINARKEDISARYEKIKITQTNINDLAKKSQDRAADIKTAHSKAVSDQDKIAAVQSRADEIKTEIEKTFHLTTDTAMKGALAERRDEIQKAMKFWRWTLLGSVSLLALSIGWLLIHPPIGGFVDALTNRLIYITPLLLVIALAYRQYIHERRVLEEYAFKAVMAQSLRNYAVLLSDNYKDADDAQNKILNFLLTSMGNIYDRSVLDKDAGFFYQLVVGNKNVGAQATIQEGAVETKTKSEKVVKQTKKQVV